MRRKEREITRREEILALLDRCQVVRLGLCAGGVPYIVPLNFAWAMEDDRLCLYFHGAAQGRKMEMIAQNPLCCFEADGEFSPLPDSQGRACGWSARYESVVGEGRIAPVEDSQAKRRALDLLMARYGFEGTPHYAPAELNSVAVLRLEADHFTGKRR